MTHAYPILTVDAANAYEAGLLKDDPGLVRAAVMNAGRAIGRSLVNDYLEIRSWPESPEILVLAGKGLNEIGRAHV